MFWPFVVDLGILSPDARENRVGKVPFRVDARTGSAGADWSGQRYGIG